MIKSVELTNMSCKIILKEIYKRVIKRLSFWSCEIT